MFTTATSGDSAALADLHRLSQASRPRPSRPLSSRLSLPAAPGYALRESGAPIGGGGPAKLRGRAGRRAGACAVAEERRARNQMRSRGARAPPARERPGPRLRCSSQREVSRSQSQNPQSRQTVWISEP